MGNPYLVRASTKLQLNKYCGNSIVVTVLSYSAPLKSKWTNMCNYDILYHNEHGYVVKCKNCEHLKLAFGTTALTLSEECFYDFKQIADEYFDIHKTCNCRTQKQVQIPTANKAVMLVYTVEELERLVGILDEAHITMEVQKLLA